MITELRCAASPWRFQGLEFLLVHRTSDGNVSYARPPEMVPVEPMSAVAIPEPTFRLQPSEAQRLMDDLWTAGYRPSEGSGSAGSLAATQAHLADLRRYVDTLLPAALAHEHNL